MQVDHAVFTSSETRMAQGYRIVASSANLTADEKKHITTASPSHSAMCPINDDNIGLSFYPLRSGRYCIARTTHAGLEQTARGGQRVLTQSFVLSADQLLAFDNNPFAILGALNRGGAFEFDELPKGQLEPIELDAPTGTSSFNTSIVDDPATFILLANTFATDAMITIGVGDIVSLLETALMFLPRPLRLNYSFTMGLKFALSRRYRLHAIGEADLATKRVIRGQPIQLVEDLRKNTPESPSHPWTDLWTDCVGVGKLDMLASLASDEFDSTDDHTLSEVATYQKAINHIADEPLEALLAGWQPVSDDELPETNIERTMLKRYITAKKSRTITAMSTADASTLTPCWSWITQLALSDENIRKACEAAANRIDELTCPWLSEREPSQPDAIPHESAPHS